MYIGLTRVNWDDFYKIDDPELAWNFLLENLNTILNEIAPIKTLQNVKHKNEWVTKELLQKIHFRDHLKLLYNKSKSNLDWARFKKARNIVSNAVRHCKKEYIQKILKENIKNPKKYWEILHDLTGRGKKKGVKIDISSDTTGSINNLEQANILNKHFAQVGLSLTNTATERADEALLENIMLLTSLLNEYGLIEILDLDPNTIKSLLSNFGINGSIKIISEQIKALINLSLSESTIENAIDVLKANNFKPNKISKSKTSGKKKRPKKNKYRKKVSLSLKTKAGNKRRHILDIPSKSLKIIFIRKLIKQRKDLKKFRINKIKSFTLNCFHPDEVLKRVKKVNIHKATCVEGINGKILKDALSIAYIPLTHLFNLIIQTNNIPNSWKRSVVVPLHKGGKKSDLNNYRPISLLPTPVKIFEKLLCIKITDFN